MGVVNTTASIYKQQTAPGRTSLPGEIGIMAAEINDMGNTVTYTPQDPPAFDPGPDDNEAEDEPEREVPPNPETNLEPDFF